GHHRLHGLFPGQGAARRGCRHNSARPVRQKAASMIVTLVLSVLLGAVLLHGWIQLRRSPLVAWMSLIAAVSGLYLVWSPAHTTEIAGMLGIGRGADLIMYLWICISLNLLLSLHLKLRLQQETITRLARHVALANAFIRTDDVMPVREAAAPTVRR